MNLRSSNLANGSGMAHCRVQPMAENFPLKGASSGSRGTLENFKLPSVFLEWMKLRTLNLASGSTTASSTRGKNSLKSVCSVASEPIEKWDGSTASASPPLPSPPSALPLSSSFPPPSSPLRSPSPSPPFPLEVGPLKSS